jgi:hypothetical protein
MENLQHQCCDIISALYTERKTNEFFNKLHPEHLRDDLRQFTFSALLEMANDNPARLIAINEKPGALFGFMTKIAKRQLTGSNSKFRKVFRAENIVDIDDRQDIDLLHQNDEFESDRDLREEILSLWATGGAVYSNDLASVQRIYAAGRALKSELKYLEELQRGLFSDCYVLYSVPVLVRFDKKTDSDQVTDAGEFLSNVITKAVGRELGRENNAFVVRTGAAVVVETKL